MSKANTRCQQLSGESLQQVKEVVQQNRGAPVNSSEESPQVTYKALEAQTGDLGRGGALERTSLLHRPGPWASSSRQ